MDVGAVNRRMTAGRPAGSQGQAGRMIAAPNEDPARRHDRPLILSMAPQAQIRIRNRQHLGVYRTVRTVARGAALAQSRMFEHHRFGLFSMALAAGFP